MKYKIEEVVKYLESHPELVLVTEHGNDIEDLKHYAKIGDAGEGWIWGFVIKDVIGTTNYRQLQADVIGLIEVK